MTEDVHQLSTSRFQKQHFIEHDQPQTCNVSISVRRRQINQSVKNIITIKYSNRPRCLFCCLLCQCGIHFGEEESKESKIKRYIKIEQLCEQLQVSRISSVSMMVGSFSDKNIMDIQNIPCGIFYRILKFANILLSFFLLVSILTLV